jgi:hypothetical protein
VETGILRKPLCHAYQCNFLHSWVKRQNFEFTTIIYVGVILLNISKKSNMQKMGI